MRLQEIYSICKSTTDNWPMLSYDEVRSGGNTYYRVQNPESIRDVLSALDAVESFADRIAAVRNTSAGFMLASGDITVDQRSKNALSNEYQHLKNKATTVAELFNSLDYRQDADGFDIKLPPDMSLSELSKCAKDLDLIFSTCPLFSNDTGTITFSAVDVGSVWLSFIIGGAAVAVTLRLIAELVDKALVIRSHYLTTKEQEQRIRSLSLGNELYENAVEINKTVSKGLLDQISTELAEKHDVNDPEDKLRLKNALQLLSDWMSKGMEIYPSILAPSETKAVFPPIEKQSLPRSVMTLLTDGSAPEGE